MTRRAPIALISLFAIVVATVGAFQATTVSARGALVLIAAGWIGLLLHVISPWTRR